jgi:hypothetical protein
LGTQKPQPPFSFSDATFKHPDRHLNVTRRTATGTRSPKLDLGG